MLGELPGELPTPFDDPVLVPIVTRKKMLQKTPPSSKEGLRSSRASPPKAVGSRRRGSDLFDHARSAVDEPTRAIVRESLLELGLRVHHEGPATSDRLADRLARDEQQPDVAGRRRSNEGRALPQHGELA